MKVVSRTREEVLAAAAARYENTINPDRRSERVQLFLDGLAAQGITGLNKREIIRTGCIDLKGRLSGLSRSQQAHVFSALQSAYLDDCVTTLDISGNGFNSIPRELHRFSVVL